ncbi:putative golgin IMH1-like [Sesbania bispinosa]|nr:putative golgin IMH1-like [Sesbania bispinosa]
MAKKKLSHPSQSLDHKTPTPPMPMDDPSVQIQNLKNLNSVLLKQTTQHRDQIESLLNDNHLLQSQLHRSSMDADSKNLALELEKVVLFVFAETQMMEMGFRFEKLVGDCNQKEHEVTVLKGDVNDLTLRFENEKVLLSREMDQVKAEAENRERMVREEVDVLRLEAQKLLEKKYVKERTIEELIKDRDLAVRSSQESYKVIEELKEEIDKVMREKNEVEMLNNTQGMKIFHLELELKQLNESLVNSRNEEALMRAKILELEESLGLAAEKEEEMAMKNSALVREKKEMEKSIEMLTESRDNVCGALDMVQKELENKQREVDEINRARDEIEQVKVNRENEIVELQGEVDRLRGVVENLRESCREFEEKNEQLLSQVQHYKTAVDEVKLEKDDIRKGLDEEKNKVENLELQVAGMVRKIEQAEAELGQMRSEQEKLNEKNKMLESHVDVLMKEKDVLQKSLLESKQECDDLRAKFESSCIKSNHALAMLKSTTAALVCHKESAEEVGLNDKKHGEEIQPYAEELDAIRKAFKSKNDMVDDMKEQVVSLQKSVAEAQKGKSLWTAISSATTVFAAALAAYVAKGR